MIHKLCLNFKDRESLEGYVAKVSHQYNNLVKIEDIEPSANIACRLSMSFDIDCFSRRPLILGTLNMKQYGDNSYGGKIKNLYSEKNTDTEMCGDLMHLIEAIIQDNEIKINLITSKSVEPGKGYGMETIFSHSIQIQYKNQKFYISTKILDWEESENNCDSQYPVDLAGLIRNIDSYMSGMRSQIYMVGGVILNNQDYAQLKELVYTMINQLVKVNS